MHEDKKIAVDRSWPAELRTIFHKLWSRDVGTVGYEKARWRLMEAWLDKLAAGEKPQTCQDGAMRRLD